MSDAHPGITWEEPFCQDASNCFRLGTDDDGNAYIAVAGQEERYLTDSLDALRTLIVEIKAGKADHLL
ncbi:MULTISPECIES: hypothetical protein [Streptomyces]|jgi:hypothetical protein|uniref:DUF397 domain-containing protein n=1 Tax=Streptomyces griseoaurantiacus TaxID=68213 RepID=A0A1G7G7T5_9ACTN|nr:MULTISPECIES: hypothetical protein [Streptomyces]NJP73864.1 hypothetical protein [Streptomyces sp. C1-2]SDE84196.1 hypothetical protein SAMN05216260_104118 [Streptomyces jietaisiensis]